MYPVQISDGTLQGEVRWSHQGFKYHSFEGVPYAKPPVGQLRFRGPQDPEPWTGVRDATKPANKCAQLDPYSQKPFQGSEDCLYLNVYTPSLPSETEDRYPVLFFIHGGRFIVGHADYYKPDYLIRHKMVIVTANYRLNILGFLALNIREAPGNCGLKDTAMALKWVQNNIAAFNGDPDNVTAFGESAGAAIATSYLTADIPDGVVHKIIAQSGNCLSDLFIRDEDCVEKARKVADMLGSTAKDARSIYDVLVSAPVEELVVAAAVVESTRHPTRLDAYFLPVVEKQFDGVQRYFKELPIATIRKNLHRKLPILTGLSSLEGALFVTKNENGDVTYENDLRHFLPRYMHFKEGSDQESLAVRRLSDFYFCNDLNRREKYLRFVSDAYFDRDMTMFLEEVARSHKNELYNYRFSYHGGMNTRVMKKLGLKGATHGDIVQYLFYRKSKAENCYAEDKKVLDFLTEAWCSFARYGKPKWSNQCIDWPPYRLEKRCTLDIGDQLEVYTDLGIDRYLVWKNLASNNSKL